ncbi:MAG TPA: hypothetical protein VGG28_29405 [Kofleriaceae bacterium]|jgi:hypothetical protein
MRIVFLLGLVPSLAFADVPTIAIGPWIGTAPLTPKSSTELLSESETGDGGHGMTGGMLSMITERGSVVLASDFLFGVGDTSGEVTGAPPLSGGKSASYTGTVYDSRFQTRVGLRAPLGRFELAAGVGIGVDVWFAVNNLGNQPGALFSPNGSAIDAYAPLWTALTVKPSCDLGVQLYAQYDVHPFTSENIATFGVNLVVQSRRCLHSS